MRMNCSILTSPTFLLLLLLNCFNGMTYVWGMTTTQLSAGIRRGGSGSVNGPTTTDRNDYPINFNPVTSFTIAHVNDLHSHFDEISVNRARCKVEDSEGGKCFGGAPRMITKVRQLREEAMSANNHNENSFMLLNAGDFFQGTVFYSELKYEPAVTFGNMMNYTAFGLGNHEFDDGAKGLLPFTQQANYDILAANIEHIEEKSDEENPSLVDTISKSKIVDMGNGVRVGIIGYVTESTAYISTPGTSVEFQNVIESVKAEAEKLESQGVKIIIALGHNGYEKDIEMAKSIPQLDLVVGGHSHTFLYDADKPLPSVEKPSGPYPTYVQQNNSKKVVPVVQAFCYTKYIGKLKVNFDEDGELVQPVKGSGVEEADMILLDSSIEKDVHAESQLQEYISRLSRFYEVIGSTEIELPRANAQESLIGDVVTDSMYEAFRENGADFAFANSGGIRSAISEGEINGVDLFNVIPFNNELVMIQLTGREFKDQLERVANNMCVGGGCYVSSFVQFSHNVKVTYNVTSGNKGDRVSSVKTNSRTCTNKTASDEEEWCEMADDQVFKVVTTDYLANKRSKILYLANFTRVDNLPKVRDYVALKTYVMNNSPLHPRLEGRVHYHEEGDMKGEKKDVASILKEFLKTLQDEIKSFFGFFKLFQ